MTRCARRLASATASLAEVGCDSPRLDAELLLAHVLGVDRAQLVMRADERATPDDSTRYLALLTRRAKREPIAYILGRKDFRHMTLAVDPRVLIPRPETELLVEVGLTLPQGVRVADVGTGSGAVALALKQERPDLEVVGVDVSSGALSVARMNAQRLRPAGRLGAGRPARRRRLRRGACEPAVHRRRRTAAARGGVLRAARCAARRQRWARLGPAADRAGRRPPGGLADRARDRAHAGRRDGRAARGGRIRPGRAAARPGWARAGGGGTGDDRVRARDRGRWGGAVPLRHRLRTRLRSRATKQRSSGSTRSRAGRPKRPPP